MFGFLIEKQGLKPLLRITDILGQKHPSLPPPHPQPLFSALPRTSSLSEAIYIHLLKLLPGGRLFVWSRGVVCCLETAKYPEERSINLGQLVSISPADEDFFSA